MNAPLSAGAIGISVSLARGMVCAVAVKSQRPQSLSRLFDGRAPDEAARLAGQIFSLCGFSQSTAARLAVARAGARVLAEEDRVAAASGLLAERIFETLRSLAMQWPGKLSSAVQAAAGAHLRIALKASRAIVAEAVAGAVKWETMAEPANALATACAGIGLGDDAENPTRGSLVDGILRDIERDEVFVARSTEALGPEDDGEVASRLCQNEAYAALPFLPDRILETGACARHPAARTGIRTRVLAQRVHARMRDLAVAVADLQALSAGRDIAVDRLMNDGTVVDSGFGAVECARGRLYHSARITEDGRLENYRILAPTEWNFHPAGPFVEMLLSAKIGSEETARLRVAKLAALFDPCVAFDITLKEIGHA